MSLSHPAAQLIPPYEVKLMLLDAMRGECRDGVVYHEFRVDPWKSHGTVRYDTPVTRPPAEGCVEFVYTIDEMYEFIATKIMEI
jgi:hypothetical protein